MAIKLFCQLGMARQALNPSTQEAEVGYLCEREASLVYTVNSRPAGATGQPCLKKK